MNRPRPEYALLAAELRALREGAALSVTALAEQSAYSRSSWHRYLSGTALPPWLAVRALCVLADEPTPRMRALWELAESAGSGRGAVQAVPVATAAGDTDTAGPAEESAATGSAPGPRRRVRGRWSPGGVAVISMLALCVAFVVATRWQRVEAREAVSVQVAQPSTSGFHVGCVGGSCTGRDPGVTLCGVEPQTLLHRLTSSGAGLEVRYNPLCKAVWARVWNTRLGDRLTLSQPGLPTQSVTVDDPHKTDAFVYTPLLAPSGRGAPLTVCLSDSPRTAATCYRLTAP